MKRLTVITFAILFVLLSAGCEAEDTNRAPNGDAGDTGEPTDVPQVACDAVYLCYGYIVELEIYDSSGERVAQFEGTVDYGNHTYEVSCPGDSYACGPYVDPRVEIYRDRKGDLNLYTNTYHLHALDELTTSLANDAGESFEGTVDLVSWQRSSHRSIEPARDNCAQWCYGATGEVHLAP